LVHCRFIGSDYHGDQNVRDEEHSVGRKKTLVTKAESFCD
jgi:hypothetical protein